MGSNIHDPYVGFITFNNIWHNIPSFFLGFLGYTFNWLDVSIHILQNNGVSFVIIYALLFRFISINNENSGQNKSDYSQTKTLWIKQGKQHVKIHLNQLKYVKTEKPYLFLHTIVNRYLYHQTLKNLLAELSDYSFVQIRRSIILNIGYINQIRNKRNGDFEVLLTDARVFKGSRRYRQILNKAMSTHRD